MLSGVPVSCDEHLVESRAIVAVEISVMAVRVPSSNARATRALNNFRDELWIIQLHTMFRQLFETDI
jgi:hypothetical protein